MQTMGPNVALKSRGRLHQKCISGPQMEKWPPKIKKRFKSLTTTVQRGVSCVTDQVCEGTVWSGCRLTLLEVLRPVKVCVLPSYR